MWPDTIVATLLGVRGIVNTLIYRSYRSWPYTVNGVACQEDMPPVRARTTPVAVRFDQDVVKRLKALAAKKHKGYQTLLKEFVAERLYEEEKREGIIPS